MPSTLDPQYVTLDPRPSTKTYTRPPRYRPHEKKQHFFTLDPRQKPTLDFLDTDLTKKKFFVTLDPRQKPTLNVIFKNNANKTGHQSGILFNSYSPKWWIFTKPRLGKYPPLSPTLR